LVATIDGDVIGHAAFSPVQIDGAAGAWWGLGPVSVAPAHQRRGVGSALIRSGLRRLTECGVSGCVVLGDPAYYRRFGFEPSGDLRYPGPPADHFMAWVAAGRLPAGRVRYHAAFDVDP
jgi:putative acetyltransferase